MVSRSWQEGKCSCHDASGFLQCFFSSCWSSEKSTGQCKQIQQTSGYWPHDAVKVNRKRTKCQKLFCCWRISCVWAPGVELLFFTVKILDPCLSFQHGSTQKFVPLKNERIWDHIGHKASFQPHWLPLIRANNEPIKRHVLQYKWWTCICSSCCVRCLHSVQKEGEESQKEEVHGTSGNTSASKVLLANMFLPFQQQTTQRCHFNLLTLSTNCEASTHASWGSQRKYPSFWWLRWKP